MNYLKIVAGILLIILGILLLLPGSPKLKLSKRSGLPYWISAEQAQSLENENFTLSPGFFDPATPMFEREIVLKKVFE